MADPRGFLKHDRVTPTMRPVPVRLLDWKEVYENFERDELQIQASRCMDCGIPFCNNGCPLGNLIPDWNDLVYQDNWQEAIESLHATNNFPEFTGRLCPAPCEGACVAGLADESDAVTIKNVELNIIEKAWEEGWVTPIIASKKTGKSVAVVGSGPAGLAVAQQLTRAGHDVTVFERADRIGGLLRYGIPEFMMEKAIIDRRLAQMEAEGTVFRTNAYVGGPKDHPGRVSAQQLSDDFDAVVLAGGATIWRQASTVAEDADGKVKTDENGRDVVIPLPGADLDGVLQAMEYLPPANAVQMGDLDDFPVSAEGKDVVIIGGGDTGADCLGTANRQGARSVHQFEIMERPPDVRAEQTPWPTWPLRFRTASAHEEGVEREYAVRTTELIADDQGRVAKLRAHRVDVDFSAGPPTFTKVPGSDFELDAELVLFAMGFTGPEPHTAVAELDLELERGLVKRDADWKTSQDNVYVCGDMGRGQSLIVWAIAEGRACAAAVDEALMGDTLLPRPVRPTDRPLN